MDKIENGEINLEAPNTGIKINNSDDEDDYNRINGRKKCC